VPLAQGLEPIFKEAESRIDACSDSLGTFAVAKWVYDQIKGLPEKDKEEEKKKSGTGKSAEKGAGEGAEKDAGNSVGGAEKDAGKGAEKKEGKASKPGEKCKPRQVEPTLDKMDGGYSGTYSRVLVQREGKHTSPYVKRDVTINVPARMRFEVKKLFENTATDEFQINRKAGSLNVRALHKAQTSDALFKRRLEADGIDSAVVIMLDVSGSMFYEQRVRDDNGNLILDPDTGMPKKEDYIRHALKTCAALVDTLNRAQVKVSIVTFGTDVSVLKPFDMSARRGLEELARVKEGGQTNDDTALR
jgi:Mg-chelatase subunit ChlD